MGYFQEVVTEYLRADRAVFVNTECLIRLHPNDISTKGAHWYCDAVAVNFREKSVHLCEVSYSTTLHALGARLQTWAKNWPALCAALVSTNPTCQRTSRLSHGCLSLSHVTKFSISDWRLVRGLKVCLTQCRLRA